MSSTTSGNGAQASTEEPGTEANREPDALCIPAKICTPMCPPLVPDVKKHVYKLLEDEPNEEQRLNLKAFISAFENGEEIGDHELFCKGRKMDWNDWQPTLGPYFMFPVRLYGTEAMKNYMRATGRNV